MCNLKRSFLILVIAGCLFWGGDSFCAARGAAVPAYNSHNLIRLHVIANSDTAADQELKRRVRDAVLASAGRSLAAAGDIDAAREELSTNLAAITAAAEAEIRREGRNDPVRTEFGDYNFPTRVYGDLTLPAGKYEALRLVIGAGQGGNWWCVLFPPLCLVDVTGKTSGAARPGQPVLAGEVTAGQMLAGEEGLPETKAGEIRVGWKILEIFNSSRHFLAGLWP